MKKGPFPGKKKGTHQKTDQEERGGGKKGTDSLDVCDEKLDATRLVEKRRMGEGPLNQPKKNALGKDLRRYRRGKTKKRQGGDEKNTPKRRNGETCSAFGKKKKIGEIGGEGSPEKKF